MPRNPQGQYTLPGGSIVSIGDRVLPSQHNPPLLDIEQALTGSLDRDGLGSMRADLNMGLNRIRNVSPGVNSSDAVNVSQLNEVASVPIGGVIDFWGYNPPPGWLFCRGQEVSRTTYSELFDVIGTGAGGGNGSTTFNVPNYLGRVSAGMGTSADSNSSARNPMFPRLISVMGRFFGESDVTLSIGEMPRHRHSGTTNQDGNHAHATLGTDAASNGISEVRGNVFGGGNVQRSPTQDRSTLGAGLHDHNFNTNYTGGGDSHENVQPTVICNKIIRAR